VITLEARIAAARRHLRPLALILLEAVHDPAGTALSIEATVAADVARETLRDADTLCRLHNGRYAILLEDTPENGAIWTVERIRRRLGEQLDDVTVWAGIACYPANGFDGPEVLDRAREALEQAREWRQDRTEVADT
jgi:GGDEF domain-containing protein